jgi:hypothetical protein
MEPRSPRRKIVPVKTGSIAQQYQASMVGINSFYMHKLLFLYLNRTPKRFRILYHIFDVFRYRVWPEVTVKFYWTGLFLGTPTPENESYWKCCLMMKKVIMKDIPKEIT